MQSPIDDRRTRQLGAVVVIALLGVSLSVPLTAFGKPEKVTICHAAGQSGTDQFVTLTLSYSAVYGNGGHFYEDGSPRAGHEGDYLGACIVESTTSTTVVLESTTSTGVAESTTTTEVIESTTTTAGETTTSQVAESTTTTEVIESTTTTAAETTTTAAETTTTAAETTTTAAETTTTAAETTTTDTAESTTTTMADTPTTEATTTTVVDEVIAAATVDPADGGAPDVEVEAVEELPFTGFHASPIMPALALLIVGVLLVFITTDRFTGPAGGHVAKPSVRFGIGLHRGRHESRDRS